MPPMHHADELSPAPVLTSSLIPFLIAGTNKSVFITLPRHAGSGTRAANSTAGGHDAPPPMPPVRNDFMGDEALVSSLPIARMRSETCSKKAFLSPAGQEFAAQSGSTSWRSSRWADRAAQTAPTRLRCDPPDHCITHSVTRLTTVSHTARQAKQCDASTAARLARGVREQAWRLGREGCIGSMGRDTPTRGSSVRPRGRCARSSGRGPPSGRRRARSFAGF